MPQLWLLSHRRHGGYHFQVPPHRRLAFSSLPSHTLPLSSDAIRGRQSARYVVHVLAGCFFLNSAFALFWPLRNVIHWATYDFHDEDHVCVNPQKDRSPWESAMGSGELFVETRWCEEGGARRLCQTILGFAEKAMKIIALEPVH